jgi:hypothetical protein
MNTRALILAPFTLFIVPLLPAQSDRPPEPGVPVTQAQSNTSNQALITPPAGENQKLYGPRQSTLITAEAAKSLSDKFRAAYGQSASPRIVVYVNRNLADTDDRLKLTGRTEKYYQSTTSSKEGAPTTTSDKSGENTYAVNDIPKPTLADQQTVREVERLFGRVFRNAGAKLADPRAAAALLADEPNTRLGGDEAAKTRDALKQIADIAVEVLISSRELTVRNISGDSTFAVPDIQVTAIRLSDSAIVGQAAASDVLGNDRQAARVAQQFAVADITEATAFALMEDMLTGAKESPAPAAK